MSAIATPIAPASPPVLELPMYRLSVAQYEAMVEKGILNENDRVELIRGLLVAKMTPQPPHAISVDLVQDALREILPAGWHVRIQAPLRLTDSVPEPDDCVTRGTRRDYRRKHPAPTDVALVVEVSDSTLASDRSTKKEMYAEAKIPTYWIVNLVDTQLEVFTDPAGSDYAVKRVLAPKDEAPLILDGREVGRVPVQELLP
ncbi:MAG: Uma2 family endonuclease [Gemmataceae bacterium]